MVTNDYSSRPRHLGSHPIFIVFNTSNKYLQRHPHTPRATETPAPTRKLMTMDARAERGMSCERGTISRREGAQLQHIFHRMVVLNEHRFLSRSERSKLPRTASEDIVFFVVF